MCGMTICDAFCFYLTHITIFYNLKALHTFNLVSFACHIVRLAGRCSCLCTTCPRMKCAWYVFAGHLRPHTRAHTHIHAHAPYNHSHSARTHTHTHAHAPYTYSHTPHAHEHTRTYALPHVNDKRRTKTETKSKKTRMGKCGTLETAYELLVHATNRDYFFFFWSYSKIKHTTI